MDGDPRDGRYVTRELWDAEHRALREAEAAEHRRLDERIGDLEADLAVVRQAANRRRDRTWTVAVTVLASLILPLLVTAVVALATALTHR